jgi:hypothetical protein
MEKDFQDCNCFDEPVLIKSEKVWSGHTTNICNEVIHFKSSWTWETPPLYYIWIDFGGDSNLCREIDQPISQDDEIESELARLICDIDKN